MGRHQLRREAYPHRHTSPRQDTNVVRGRTNVKVNQSESRVLISLLFGPRVSFTGRLWLDAYDSVYRVCSKKGGRPSDGTGDGGGGSRTLQVSYTVPSPIDSMNLPYSSQPITAWGQAFPVPKNQPNRAGTAHPLISPRSPWADVGVILQNDARPYRSITSRPCLLGDDGKQRSFLFANDGLVLSDCWRKVNVLLPMPDLDEMKERVKNNRPRSEFDSPFLRVRHNLKIKMVCRDGYTGLLVSCRKPWMSHRPLWRSSSF